MIARLGDLAEDEAPTFGGKAAMLGAMLREGLPVFDGVALSTSCYRDALAAGGALDPATDFWRAGAAGAPDEAALAAASDAVARGLDGYDASRLAASVLDLLDEQRIAASELMVRSSATGEDSADLSYAGQFSSYRCPADRQSVETAIRAVWKSCTAPHVPLYHAAFASRGTGSTATAVAAGVEMGVVVQPHSSFALAGLLFTRHPTVAVSGWMLLEYLDAEPSELVAGTVLPHRCRVAADDGRVAWERQVPDRPVLSPTQVDALRAAGARLAELVGTDVDVEWGLLGDTPYLLQCRPATTAPGRSANGASG